MSSSPLKPVSFVVLDNTDLALTYSSSNWTMYTDDGMNAVGDWGPPYQETLHRISGDGSVSFSFTGEFIHAYASFNNTAADSLPNWKCLIDDNAIANISPPDSPTNNWEICNSAGTDISDGVHNFTLEITDVKNTTMFWLDWISYRPPDGYVVSEGTMYFPPGTADVTYSGNWQEWGLYDQIGAAEAGASAVLSYRGVSLRWYGFLWGVTTPSTGKGVYTVDDGSPVYFTWDSQKNHTTYRHLFFQTPNLNLGRHVLHVTFLGSTPNLLPLSLTAFQVDIHSGPNATTPTTVNLHNITAIYGGVLGGLSAIFVFGALGCIIAWKYRQKSRWKQNRASEQPTSAGITEAPKSTPLHNNSKEPARDSGRPSCEGEDRQEIQMQMSPGPSRSNGIP